MLGIATPLEISGDAFSVRHIHFVDSIHIFPAGLSIVNSGEHMGLWYIECVEAKYLQGSQRPPLW